MPRASAAIEGPGRVVVRPRIGRGRAGRSRPVSCRVDCLGRGPNLDAATPSGAGRTMAGAAETRRGSRGWRSAGIAAGRIHRQGHRCARPSPDAVSAHAIAYSAAFHQHQDVEAGHLLETCLRLSSCVAPAMREALMSDAAVFQARRRKRPDLAEQWLAAIPATSPQSWLRPRAEAAMLEANGDFEGGSSESWMNTRRRFVLCPTRRNEKCSCEGCAGGGPNCRDEVASSITGSFDDSSDTASSRTGCGPDLRIGNEDDGARTRNLRRDRPVL